MSVTSYLRKLLGVKPKTNLPIIDVDKRFEILGRTILPSSLYMIEPFSGKCEAGLPNDGYNLAMFRGTDPHIYRVDIYEYGSTCCDDQGNNFAGNALLIALEFTVNWDSQGRLTTGTVRVLPACRNGQDLDCTPAESPGLALFIVPPIFPGHGEEPPFFRTAPYVNFVGFTPPIGVPGTNVLSATINWADILKNTALNSP